MPRYLKWILIELVIFAVTLTGVVALVILVIQPHTTVNTNMPKDGAFTIRQMDSGELEITWPKADRAEYYLFQLYQLPNDGQLSYQNDAGTLVYEAEVKSGNRVVLPSDAYSGNMLFRVRSAVTYEFNGAKNIRFSENAVQTVTRFDPPAIEQVTCETNSEKQTAVIRLQVAGGTSCHVSVKDASGALQLLKTIDGTIVTLNFGEGGDLPMPAFGESVQLHFTTYRDAEGVIYYSTNFAEFTIDRSMLVPADILLEYTYEDEGCHLSWEEEECDYYEIQSYDAATGSWSVLGIVNGDEACTYLLTDLQPDQTLVIRVVAAYEKEQESADGQIQVIVKYRSVSNEVGVSAPVDQPEPEEVA